MDESHFRRLVKRTRMHWRSQEMARLYFVHHVRDMTRIALELGAPRAAAYRAVKRIGRELARERAKEGWEVVTVVVPPEDKPRVLEIEEQAIVREADAARRREDGS